MTDTNTLAPTDSEILDAAEDFRSQYTHGGTTFDEFDEIGFARAVLEKWGTPPAVAGEPVAIYHGRCTIDCGEHGHLDMELLKMIPAGSKLYTAPQPALHRKTQMTENQPLNCHTLALDAQRLTKASKDISTVLRVEGLDLEIGSRKLLKEAREAIDAAIAAQPPAQALDALKQVCAIAVSAAKTNSRDIADWREDMDRIAAIAAQKGTNDDHK